MGMLPLLCLVHKNGGRSHPAIRQKLVLNTQRVSAVIFSHVFLASLGQAGNFLTWRLHLQWRARTIPNSKKYWTTSPWSVSEYPELAFPAAASQITPPESSETPKEQIER